MYEEYFGLSGSPFKLNPDPKFFFGSRSHNKAMAYLHYGLKQAEGFIVITGPVGAGKSMVISHLIDQLTSSNVVAATLLAANVSGGGVLRHILSAFRIEPENDGPTGEFEAFEDFLFDQLNRGRRVLLILDEAQNLPRETLEELRVLSNMDYDGTPLFQIFLVGQPEFRKTVEAPEMEQLRQRVIAAYHLEKLSLEETREYIFHRLAIVGWKQDPAFRDSAFEAIFDETGGLPRRINTLCNRVLLQAAMEKRHDITADAVAAAIGELKEERINADLDAGDRAPTPEAPPADEPAPAHDAGLKTFSLPTSSVFDRLRAKKRSAGGDQSAGPETATLSDVASAIAAASAGEPRDFASDAGEAAMAQGAAASPAMLETITQTRAALSEANEAVARLQKSMSKMRRRQNETREQVAASLTRAESLLDALRDVWK